MKIKFRWTVDVDASRKTKNLFFERYNEARKYNCTHGNKSDSQSLNF